MAILPNEIFDKIILSSDARSVMEICRVNKTYSSLFRTEKFWKRYLSGKSFEEFLSLVENIRKTSKRLIVYKVFIEMNKDLKPFGENYVFEECDIFHRKEDILYIRTMKMKAHIIYSLFNTYSVRRHGLFKNFNESSILYTKYKQWDLLVGYYHIRKIQTEKEIFHSFINAFMEIVVVKNINMKKSILSWYPVQYIKMFGPPRIRRDHFEVMLSHKAAFIVNNCKNVDKRLELANFSVQNSGESVLKMLKEEMSHVSSIHDYGVKYALKTDTDYYRLSLMKN
jgi:hypothetical protein